MKKEALILMQSNKEGSMTKEQKKALAEFLDKMGIMPDTAGEVVISISPEKTVSMVRVTRVLK